jgi:hypothetical protein
MKARLVIAMAIGALISTIFLAIPSLRDGTSPWAFLELPGMIAVFLAGPVSSDILFLALAWAVNAVVYGLVALAVLGILSILKFQTDTLPVIHIRSPRTHSLSTDADVEHSAPLQEVPLVSTGVAAAPMRILISPRAARASPSRPPDIHQKSTPLCTGCSPTNQRPNNPR